MTDKRISELIEKWYDNVSDESLDALDKLLLEEEDND